MFNNLNKLYYIREFTEASEGGISRDLAFYNYILNTNSYKVKFLKNKKSYIKKISNAIKEMIYLSKLKNKEIFLHQNSLNEIIPVKLFSNNFIGKFISKTLEEIALKNRLIIEINDLIYEQSLDLNLLTEIQRETALKFQKEILNLKNVKYIFASEEMKNYCIKHYGTLEKNSYTCINGSIVLEDIKDNLKFEVKKEIKCIYAGTLNKGRQIENLIDIFENKVKNFKLILIGVNGEWILEKEYKNVDYLGSYKEVDALQIVSKCQLGLVPYDNKKFYYNLCYPTKNSFYISAGIPMLITPLKESLNQLEKYDILFIEELNKWPEILNSLTLEELENKKKNVQKIKTIFTWNNLIKECFIKIK